MTKKRNKITHKSSPVRLTEVREDTVAAAIAKPIQVSDRDMAFIERELAEAQGPNAALRTAAKRFHRAIAEGEILFRDR